MATDTPQVIIHHLANIHYSADAQYGGNAALHTYLQPLIEPGATLPNLIVITGNLTLAGTADELRQVAETLHPLAQAMNLAKHRGIVVVPGPSDLLWLEPGVWARKSQRKDQPKKFEDAIAAAYRTFYQYFPTDLYTIPGRVPHHANTHFLLYTLDTCYQPDQGIPEKDLSDAERVFAGSIALHDNERRHPDRLLQQMILAAPQDRGQINDRDIDLFGSVRGAEVNDKQLRILATHHPLFACSVQNAVFQVPEQVMKALTIAQDTQFQLLLHGHTHVPTAVATTYPPSRKLSETGILQVGGGSFVAAPYNALPTYNQLTARYNEVRLGAGTKETPFWSVDLQTLALPAQSQTNVTPTFTAYRNYPLFLLGNANSTLISKVEKAQKNDDESDRRKTLERRLNLVLRDLANMLEEGTRIDIYNAMQERSYLIEQRLVEERARVDVNVEGSSEIEAEQKRFEAVRRARETLRMSHSARLQPALDVSDRLSKMFDTIREMFTLVIFKDVRTSVGLALKPRTAPSAPLLGAFPVGVTSTPSAGIEQKLVANAEMPYTYMRPNSDVGPLFRNGLPYISTLAGWSVILGDIHTHLLTPDSVPDIGAIFEPGVSGESPVRAAIDVDWLRVSNKLERVIDELRIYSEELAEMTRRSPNEDLSEESKRVGDLIRDLQNNDQDHQDIAIERLFMKRTFTRNGPYVPFVSVAVPLRENGHEPNLEEMGVIQVDVAETDVEKVGSLTGFQREMLRTVSHLVWLILMTTRIVENYQHIGKGQGLAYQALDADRHALEQRLANAYREIAELNKRPYR